MENLKAFVPASLNVATSDCTVNLLRIVPGDPKTTCFIIIASFPLRNEKREM